MKLTVFSNHKETKFKSRKGHGLIPIMKLSMTPLIHHLALHLSGPILSLRVTRMDHQTSMGMHVYKMVIIITMLVRQARSGVLPF